MTCSNVLIFGPIGSHAPVLARKIAKDYDYNIVNLEEAVSIEKNLKSTIGRKIIKSIRCGRDDPTVIPEILSKSLDCDRWLMEGFPPNMNLISSFDHLERYPDMVIVLENTQVVLLDRFVRSILKDNIHEINCKIVEYLDKIDSAILEFEKMNIPVYTINDNKPVKNIYEITVDLINYRMPDDGW
jgi:adenylate kinase family enzyme